MCDISEMSHIAAFSGRGNLVNKRDAELDRNITPTRTKLSAKTRTKIQNCWKSDSET